MTARTEARSDIVREPLLVTRTAERVTLTLNHPGRHNALDAATVEALHSALDEIGQTGTRMLVLEGAGPSFCSGFDLSEIDSETDGSLLLRFVRIELLLQRLFRAPYHTVALAHGRAYGAGADLFCACQHRFAAPDTTFRFPGTHFGLVLGSGRLAARAGIDAALALLRAAKPIDATRAKASALVSDIVATDERASRLDRLACEETVIAPDTMELILGLALPASDQNDLSNLVRSAARPGLKRRIMDYAAAGKRQR